MIINYICIYTQYLCADTNNYNYYIMKCGPSPDHGHSKTELCLGRHPLDWSAAARVMWRERECGEGGREGGRGEGGGGRGEHRRLSDVEREGSVGSGGSTED